MFARHCDAFNSHVEQARATIGDEIYEWLLVHIVDNVDNISYGALEAHTDTYAKKVTKSQK